MVMITMFSKHCYLCITILILLVVAHHNINIDHQTLIVITQICEKLLLTMYALNHDFVWKEGLLYLFSAERLAGWITESMCSSWMVDIYTVDTIFLSALEGSIPNLCRPTVLHGFKHCNGHVDSEHTQVCGSGYRFTEAGMWNVNFYLLKWFYTLTWGSSHVSAFKRLDRLLIWIPQHTARWGK